MVVNLRNVLHTYILHHYDQGTEQDSFRSKLVPFLWETFSKTFVESKVKSKSVRYILCNSSPQCHIVQSIFSSPFFLFIKNIFCKCMYTCCKYTSCVLAFSGTVFITVPIQTVQQHCTLSYRSVGKIIYRYIYQHDDATIYQPHKLRQANRGVLVSGKSPRNFFSLS